MKKMALGLTALTVCALWTTDAASEEPFDFAKALLPQPAAPGPKVQPYVKHSAGKIAITHVRVIDGTGAPAQPDMTVLLDRARIVAVQSAAARIPAGYSVIDGTGQSLMPGIIGMHDHFFRLARPNLTSDGYDGPRITTAMSYSTPRLSLAAGVTTLRTTGTFQAYADVNLKAAIDEGASPGPHMDVTGPYLQGATEPSGAMHVLTGPEDARHLVDYWSDVGVTSFKAHQFITLAELRAAVDEAHRRGRKLAAHVCSVTYPDAIAAGVDSLEHGFWYNTQLEPAKQADVCPRGQGEATLLAMEPGGDEARALIRSLIDNHVALTSTLATLEMAYSPDFRPRTPKELEAMAPQVQRNYLLMRTRIQDQDPAVRARDFKLWQRELALEKEFFDAGGLLMAGPDPTGWGDIVPGFGDQRGIELLVQAGLTPVQAIRVGSLNAATYLGVADRIGTIAPGKNADLVLVKGDPSSRIEDMENVVTVFKDGVGYDSDRLLEAARGSYGLY